MAATGKPARILIVAGSDSGGGAGIQADLKAVTCLQGFAMTAIAALTAQNTLGVMGIHPVPLAFVAEQMQLVLSDIGADAVKTGMLATAALIQTVAETLAAAAPGVPLVVDPVMVAKGGQRLIEDDAVDAFRRVLFPRATLITPNLPEAEVLTGRTIQTPAAMEEAGRALLALGPRAVLMKGGHLPGDAPIVDLLVTPDAVHRFEGARVETPHTHGTGCTLASAIATGLGQGLDLPRAVDRAHRYVAEAILNAPGLGHGHGPLGHGFTVRPFV